MATDSGSEPNIVQIPNSPTNSPRPLTGESSDTPCCSTVTPRRVNFYAGRDDSCIIFGSHCTEVESSSMNIVGAGTEKPDWNKPSGGALVRSESWPALSETARASPTPSSVDINALSINQPHEVEVGSDQAEVASPTQSSSSIHIEGLTSQTSIKLDGASSNQSSKPADGSSCQAPSVQTVVVEGLPPNRGDFGVAHSRPLAQGYNGGRRDPERGRHNWDNHNGRQQRFDPTPFIGRPPPNAPFIPHPPHPGAVRPFVYPMVYSEVPPRMPYPRGPHPVMFRPPPMVPFTPPFNPVLDLELPSKIVKQVDYYFSYDNLVKDTYLREKMDGNGWVPIKLIAEFKMIMCLTLTNDIQFITNALHASNVVEVEGDKLRLRNDWNRWILPSTSRSS